MTALDRFALLEAEGAYRADPDAEARPVLVKFGDASLTIMRFDETPIDHWPLASLRRTAEPGPGLTLAPDAGAPERLRLEDPTMIAAIREVARGVDARPRGPAPRRRRRWRGPALAAALLLGAALGLRESAPRAAEWLAAAAPPAARAALGDAAIRRHAAGAICGGAAGRRALDRLAARLADPDAPRPRLVVVKAAQAAPAAPAPGGRIAISAEALAASDGPAPILAAIAAARAAARAEPPMATALAAAGPLGALELLRGAPAGDRLTRAAAEALARPVGADPGPGAAPPLAPPDWAALKSICDE